MSNLAVVIPTLRPKSYERFLKAWKPLFTRHRVHLIKVVDGENPVVVYKDKTYSTKEVMGKYASCLTNFNAGIRNLGFAYVAKYLPQVEFILTLDDDLIPVGDTIKDHLKVLGQSVPISWMSTASEYMRGFPYSIRGEAEVVLSHGVWTGVADWDAPTQLVKGNHPVGFYQGPIPKGIYFPMCSMNLAFKRELLPYIFHAPWALGINRFDDIFAGITAKRAIDKKGWAAVSGFACVHHERESNTFSNLKHEAPGIELNEVFWKGKEDHPYFTVYRDKLATWQEFINKEAH